MKRIIIPFIVLLLCGCSGTKVSDEAVSGLYRQLDRLWGKSNISVKDLERATLDVLDSCGIEFSKMNLKQLNAAGDYKHLAKSSSLKKSISDHLQKFISDKSVQGAHAAMNLFNFSTEKDSGRNASRALAHPALGQLISDTVHSDKTVNSLLKICEIDSLAGKAMEILANGLANVSEKSYLNTVELFKRAINAPHVEDISLDKLRMALLKKNAAVGKGLDKTKNPSLAKKVDRNNLLLNSKYARRKLIGSQTPEIEFIWNSQGNVKKLSAYKDKVIVLDFWATWCGPCFRSFSNIRALQERYKGYDVEIIGITSLQGRHTVRKDGKTESIVTKGDSLKEFRLMKEFIKDCNITWKIAFSSTSCFNGDYGVFGIPHVAIIDTKGIVRYNALRPYNAPFHEAEKIDALLKEVGKKFPKDPMSTKNFSE